VRFKSLFGYALENKKRFLLSLIGIAIGVFSLTLMLGVSSAMKRRVNSVIGKMGSLVLVVLPGEVKNLGGRVIQISFYPTLKLEDAKAIKEKCLGVSAVSPFKKVSPNVHYKGKYYQASVFGVSPEYLKISGYELLCGRFLNREDLEGISQRAVIGYEVARELYGKECPVGEDIYLYNAPYRIIGVLKERGTDLSGEDLDNRVFIPVTSAVKRISNVDYIDGIYVLSRPGFLGEVEKNVFSLLKERHGKKDFTVNRYEDLVNTKRKAMEIFSRLSIIVALISFGIGSLGILAVMTLSVYERMVEIGVKRAFGAPKRAVFIQFLLESAVLSLTGALFGALTSSLIVFAITKVANWPPYFPLKESLFSLLISFLIGLISGVYPAVRALSFEPKEILREEL
jgi:putative ABC transport system permease protein